LFLVHAVDECLREGVLLPEQYAYFGLSTHSQLAEK
jgi:hypothetical protein